jgi:cysteine desulfurase
LVAIGWGEAVAKTGIRLTLGHGTTEADVDWAAMVLGQVLDRATRPVIIAGSGRPPKSPNSGGL